MFNTDGKRGQVAWRRRAHHSMELGRWESLDDLNVPAKLWSIACSRTVWLLVLLSESRRWREWPMIGWHVLLQRLSQPALAGDQRRTLWPAEQFNEDEFELVSPHLCKFLLSMNHVLRLTPQDLLSRFTFLMSDQGQCFLFFHNLLGKQNVFFGGIHILLGQIYIMSCLLSCCY